MWLWALALLTGVRLVAAAAMPISADEAYYWVWSRALAPGYLDHPPMVALWIRLGTAVVGETELGVRLLAPLAAAAGTLLLAMTGDALFPGRRVGLVAGVLMNATLMLGAGAVTMTPDTPAIFFWTATLAALVRVRLDPAWWLVVGVTSGLALDSKYTAAFLGVGIVLWLALCSREQFSRWQLWAGGAIAALLFAPVAAWNAAHGWASFAKQGARTGDWIPAQALAHLGELMAGQVALATPWVAVLFGAGLVMAVRRARLRDPAWTLIAAMTLPALLVFVQHAVGDRVQANWPSVVYPGAALAAAALGWRWRGAAALGLAIGLLVLVQATAAPLQLPRAYNPLLVRLGGWDRLVASAAGLGAGRFVAAENYGLASLLAWHAPGTRVLAVGPRWALFDLPRADPSIGTGVLILSTRRSEPPDRGYWTNIDPLADLVRAQDGVVAETFRAYDVTLRGPATILPERRP